jgi:hypothetical protein
MACANVPSVGRKSNPEKSLDLRQKSLSPRNRQLAPKYTVRQLTPAGSAYYSFVKSDILASVFKMW